MKTISDSSIERFDDLALTIFSSFRKYCMWAVSSEQWAYFILVAFYTELCVMDTRNEIYWGADFAQLTHSTSYYNRRI